MMDEPHKELGGVFSTQGMATKEGKPFVMTFINEEPFGQLTPAEAIAMGTRMIQSAIEAERDAGTISFLRSMDSNISDEEVFAFIIKMREHREQAEPKEGLGN